MAWKQVKLSAMKQVLEGGKLVLSRFRKQFYTMISTGDLKKGVTIEFEGQLCNILDWQHVKIGRGGAIVRMKLRNIRSGAIFDRTCDAGDKFKRIYLDRSTASFQYQDGDQYHFMDTSTFDDIVLSGEQLGEAKNYLIDNLELDIMLYEGEPISVDLPEKVVLTVTYTEPGFKGDTATGGNKPATTETGLVVQVPLFITTGDRIRINTTTGQYVERV